MKQQRLQTIVSMLGALVFASAIACHAADKSAKGAKDTKDAKHWAYSGKTGPDKWDTLEKDFAQCKLGQFQSPIDIPDKATRKGDFPSLLFVYKPTPLRIIDNGHTIQVNYAPGSSFSVAGKRYELLQFHFHKPSEEKIDGRGRDMVAHLVHKGADGKLGVIAVLLERGKENALIKTLWDNIPKVKESETVVENAMINAVDLLPDNKGYYSFAGSLTTPPCSEEVTWYVFKSPMQVSADQVARFDKLYPMNARPVQPLNGRDITATP